MIASLVKRIGNRSSVILGQRFATTGSGNLVEITKSESDGVSIVSMARAPVNGLNLPLLSDLKDALSSVQKSGGRGVILTSSLATVFSAGLDIMEMYKPDENRVVKFWTTLQDTWIALYGFDLPTAAAINGSSPAGGCLLAMACDYRVMVKGKHTIGLNETQLGIVAPKWFMGNMIDTIGYRAAESALLRGKLFSTEEALKIGLVDDLVADKQEAVSKCQEYIGSFPKFSDGARLMTKKALRNDRIEWLKNNRDADIAGFLNYIKNPKVQKGLDLYVQQLKGQKK